jgi:hypothetical protein
MMKEILDNNEEHEYGVEKFIQCYIEKSKNPDRIKDPSCLKYSENTDPPEKDEAGNKASRGFRLFEQGYKVDLRDEGISQRLRQRREYKQEKREKRRLHKEAALSHIQKYSEVP